MKVSELFEGAMTTMPVRGEKPMALPLETKKAKNPAIGTLAFERLPKWKQAELRKASDERTQKQIDREKAKISEDKRYFVNFESWKMAVKAANPGKTLQFKGRIEGGKHLIYAEVKGEDRCYAVWDDDRDEGELLGEGLIDWAKSIAAKIGKWLMSASGTEEELAKIRKTIEDQIKERELEERKAYQQIAAHLSDAQIRKGVKHERTPTKLRRAMEVEFKSRFA
jgi:hypothetical protein